MLQRCQPLAAASATAPFPLLSSLTRTCSHRRALDVALAARMAASTSSLRCSSSALREWVGCRLGVAGDTSCV